MKAQWQYGAGAPHLDDVFGGQFVAAQQVPEPWLEDHSSVGTAVHDGPEDRAVVHPHLQVGVLGGFKRDEFAIGPDVEAVFGELGRR